MSRNVLKRSEGLCDAPCLIRPTSLAMLSLILALCCTLASGFTYYFSPTASRGAWSGSCLVADCDILAPCPVETTTVSSGTQCDLVFLGGTYTSGPKSFTYTAAQLATIYLAESITNLSITVTYASPMYVTNYVPAGADPAPTSSTLHGSSSIVLTANTNITVSNINFAGLSTLNAFSHRNLTITNCNFTFSQMTTLTALTAHTDSLTISNTTMSTNGQVAIYHDPFSAVTTAITMVDSTFIVPNGVLSSSSSTVDVKLFNCQIDATNPNAASTFTLFSASGPLSLSIEDSKLVGFPGYHNIPLLSPSASVSPYEFYNSSFNGIKLDNYGSGTYFAQDCNFTDVLLTTTRPIDWKNVKVTQNISNGVISISNGGTADNVTFTNPNSIPGVSFKVAGSCTLSTPNKFSVSHLEIGSIALFQVDNLEVTDSIVGVSLSNSFVQASNAFPPTWTFHSIVVTNVSVHLNSVGKLVYVPSNETKGITKFNAQFAPKPNSVSIDWSSKQAPPPFLQEYPIVEIDGQLSVEEVPVVAMQPDYTFTASFLSPPLLSFRSFYSGTPTPTSCASPPPGFVCSPSGVLYAPGSISGESITIPSGSGVVGILGNVTLNTTITFTGTESSLNATGCVEAPGGVTIQLEHGKPVPKGPVTLVTQSETCSPLALTVTVNQDKNECSKTSVTQDPSSSPNTLTVLFTVDNSGCKKNTNTKWIILGAVLGSVVLILVVLMLVFTLNPKARACIRPYEARKNPTPSGI